MTRLFPLQNNSLAFAKDYQKFNTCMKPEAIFHESITTIFTNVINYSKQYGLPPNPFTTLLSEVPNLQGDTHTILSTTFMQNTGK